MLVIEGITGLLLMATYSPSTTNAWASVHYIEQLPGGAFIRGLHYWTAHAMIVLFAVHTIRVFASAAFRAPRELVWITGVLMIPLLTVWAVILVPFLVVALVSSGAGAGIVGEVLIAILTTAGVDLIMVLPFVILSFANPFFRERLKDLLNLGQEAPPMITAVPAASPA